MWMLALLACPDPVDDSATVQAADPGIALVADGWLRGDFHVHTLYEGGWEDVATNIGLAEALETDAFVAAHPEYEGNGLDFVAITDHRTVEQQSDPDYVSDRLVLVGGEEFGGKGHAGLHGVHERVDHDPDGDGSDLEDQLAGIAATHAQGATFSPNHPFLLDIPWPWDTEDHDGIEIWNSGWALMAPPFGEEDLVGWEARYGTAGAAYRRAVQAGGTSSDQALAWNEAQLALGRHKALIGGSDRHAVLLPGFPTTYVRVDETSEAGVVEAVTTRRTFVARTPAAAQVLVLVEAPSGTFGLGDSVPISGGDEVSVTVRVGRARGGHLEVRGGGAVASEEELADLELGVAIQSADVDSADFSLSFSLTPEVGDWLYPVVTEPLVFEGATEAEAESVRELARAVVETGGEDFIGLANLFVDLADPDVLFDGGRCFPEDWRPDMLQCIPADSEGLATFYVPDRFDRALNVIVRDGEITDSCMGAVGSAVRFVGAER